MPWRWQRIAELRAKATRARDLADTVARNHQATANLKSYADDLDAEADRFEAELRVIIAAEKPKAHE